MAGSECGLCMTSRQGRAGVPVDLSHPYIYIYLWIYPIHIYTCRSTPSIYIYIPVDPSHHTCGSTPSMHIYTCGSTPSRGVFWRSKAFRCSTFNIVRGGKRHCDGNKASLDAQISHMWQVLARVSYRTCGRFWLVWLGSHQRALLEL